MGNWGTSPTLPDILKLGQRPITYGEAICEAMHTALSDNSSVRVLGEGVTDSSGIYGTTKNLDKEFGSDRVFDVPLAESLITGIGIGMALLGLKPIVIHPRNDFLLLAMDQLCNQAAKWRYMFGDKINVPLVTRSIICRGWGSGAQHSQALHSILAYFPGLKVPIPFTPYDAKGFLLWAVFEAQDPVIIIEHKWLYKLRGNVPEKRYICNPGFPEIIKKGKDITLVGISYGVADALQAAKQLEDSGIEAEVVDIRSLKPLQTDTICKSVEKTGRLMVIDSGHILFGASAEIVTQVVEKIHPSRFKLPPVRVGLPDSPTPASSEETYYFKPKDITAIAIKMMKGGNKQ